MAGGGLGGALAGLSSMYGGYKQGEIDEFKIDDVKRQELAKVAMGNALMLMGGQGQGGQPQQPPQGFGQQGAPPPGMPPGQPSQPMQSPGSGPATPGPGGMPPRAGGPGMPPGGPPGAVGGPAPPMMQRPGMGPGGAPAQGMPPQGAPGMGQPPGQPRQQLDWRQLVQAVQQSNPDIKPDVLAEAVNQFLPMMNAQSQQEWRQVSLQIREQALQQREQQVMMLEQVADKRLDQQEKQFETREARLQESLKLREDSTYQRLEQQKQAAIQRAQASQGKQGLAEVRAAIDAQDKHVRTKIMAASASNTMKPAEKKALLDQADKEYNDQIEILRNQFGGKAGAGKTAPASTKPVTSSGPSADAVTVVQTPEEAQKLPPGTRYKTPDGQEYTR
jgi:hypothetical protein